MKKLLLVPIILSLAFTACSSNNTNSSVSNQENKTNKISQESKDEIVIKQISGEELQTINDNFDSRKDKTVIIDVRSPEEYDEGHLEHAINISMESIESDPSQLDEYKDKPIIVYCRSGRRSMIVANILLENGFTDITNADGVSNYNYNLVKSEN